MSEVYYCKDENCNNKICRQTFYYGKGYCRKHSAIIRSIEKPETIGKNYIDGRSLKINFCTCGNIIKYYESKVCNDCKDKEISKTKIRLYAEGEIIPWNKGKKRAKEENLKISKGLKKYWESLSMEMRSLLRGGTGIPYENNNYPEKYFKIRKLILKRDFNTCQNCHKLGKYVHHVDYNKKNNNFNNLITVCHSCNMKANYNKLYFKHYFISILQGGFDANFIGW